jgi:hypothetical protein
MRRYSGARPPGTTPRGFGVRLVADEIVNGGLDRVPRPLVRANGVDLMADHRQDLKRHHRLVILDEVTDEHQDLLIGHLGFSSRLRAQ